MRMPAATDQPRSQLRLIAGRDTPAPGHDASTSMPRFSAGGGGVLVAGTDAQRRTRMLDELRCLLPEGTRFAEAHETWQAVSLAAGSRMAILTGDLEDISAQRLMRLLRRRYPALPVICLRDGGVATGGLNAASI